VSEDRKVDSGVMDTTTVGCKNCKVLWDELREVKKEIGRLKNYANFLEKERKRLLNALLEI